MTQEIHKTCQTRGGKWSAEVRIQLHVLGAVSHTSSWTYVCGQNNFCHFEDFPLVLEINCLLLFMIVAIFFVGRLQSDH